MKICIIGGGTTGWWAAGYLEHRFPDFEITLIESDTVPKIGVGESTLPQIGTFLREMGIEEKDWMDECHAIHKFGNIKYNWDKPDGDPFRFTFWATDYKTMDDWIEKYRQGFVDKENLNDTFYNSDKPGSVAYHLDAEKAGELVKNHCKKVTHIVDTIEELPEGYDLYLDCTGFARKFIKDREEIIFDHHMVDRAWVCPYERNEICAYTKSIAREHGWQFMIDLQNRLGTGYVFSSSHVSEDEALENFMEFNKNLKPYMNKKPRLLKWEPNILKNPWSDNVVAIGLSSGFIDPLEANALYMTVLGIKSLAKCIERGYGFKTYNRHMRQVWSDNSIYILHHYMLSTRDDTEFWKFYSDFDVRKTVWDHFLKNDDMFKYFYSNSIYLTLALYYDQFDFYDEKVKPALDKISG